jgi:hypothetical protein
MTTDQIDKLINGIYWTFIWVLLGILVFIVSIPLVAYIVSRQIR